MKIGYSRISTTYQNHDMQVEALLEYGCEKIYKEQASGSKQNRVELANLLKALRPGDELVIWKLDRLCRSVSHLISICEQLEEKEVTLVSITDNINQNTPAGKAMLMIMGVVAEMERDLIRERVKTSLETRKKKGLINGRPTIKQSKLDTAKKLLDAGESYTSVAKILKVSRTTLYTYFPVK